MVGACQMAEAWLASVMAWYYLCPWSLILLAMLPSNNLHIWQTLSMVKKSSKEDLIGPKLSESQSIQGAKWGSSPCPLAWTTYLLFILHLTWHPTRGKLEVLSARQWALLCLSEFVWKHGTLAMQTIPGRGYDARTRGKKILDAFGEVDPSAAAAATAASDAAGTVSHLSVQLPCHTTWLKEYTFTLSLFWKCFC